MTDAAFPDRLTQLRAKWEADPTSRVFLQLAEEYRHLGRVKEGLAVLERGLKEHPGYLSALVAKGRCHLELGEGEAARAVLERVVKQDATQMVANKLLVRAYLETGEPGKARERLDLYSLLNDSDPEIEELRRRIRSMDRPAAPAEVPRQMDADPFSLEPPVVRREVREAKADDIFALSGLAAAPPPPVLVVEKDAEEEEPGGLLFPGLASRDRRQRYLDGLAAEGLFAFAVPEPAPPEPIADESSWLEEVSATSYPLTPAEPEEVAPPALIEPAADDLWEEEPAPPPPAIEEPPALPVEPVATATATLGELYLRQGHLAEAERIFREVLEHEPDNAVARGGLDHLAQVAQPEEAAAAAPLDAHQLLAGFQPTPGQAGGAGVTARKIFLLNSYLKRLRRGSARDVS
jgi:tetratricopeptide (TPR) repeat protein